MKPSIRVASPPAKPLVIFDGDCGFCRFWIRRWQSATGEAVEYLPFQEAQIAARFPEIPVQDFEDAVQLIETDGTVYRAAEAAFRALAHNPREQWLLDWYRHSRGFANCAEWVYRFIARHRTFFSAVTRLAWGSSLEPPTYKLVQWLFLRGMGVIYLIAFLSLAVQVTGLVGSHGILPAEQTIHAAREGFTGAKIEIDRYHLLPTLCWLGTSDSFLRGQCVAGICLAGLVILDFAPAPCLFLLWALYLSLTTICREFLGFQWDNLLLEVGVLAIFFAPLRILPRRPRNSEPSRIVLWLLRWLLFKLMFQSGCVKLLSGDPTWRQLTALDFHYETQPLPTPLAWYAAHFPAWFQKWSVAAMFGIELVVPFFIFLPRRLRQTACVAFLALQVSILLTGNYCFFNLLTMLLCLALLDDSAVGRVFRFEWFNQGACSSAAETGPNRGGRAWGLRQWPRLVTVPLALVAVVVSLVEFSAMFRLPMPWPRPILSVCEWLAPFRSFNSYGLFAVMTTSRPEIILEGSDDGQMWFEYGFKYKPGELKARPKFVEPYQPRLDWQMWFAALSNYQRNPWLISVCVHLLRGTPEVLKLLGHNPFPSAPPRYVRALLYEYHFTDAATRRAAGAWWWREPKGEYLPVLSLRDTQ